MSKYIDADLPMEAFKKYIDNLPTDFTTITEKITCEIERNVIRACINALEELPVADVKSVRYGKWVNIKDKNGAPWVCCSECGFQPNRIGIDINYCSKCGAKMSGGVDSERICR